MSKPQIRCSNLDAMLGCPGSRTLIEALGCARSDHSASWEGNWCHHEAAKRLVVLHGAIPPETGLPPPDLPANYTPPSFAHWIVDFYVNRCLEAAGGVNAMEVESEMLHDLGDFWLSGHCDFCAISSDGTELSFRDLKTGVNVVDEAERNWQIFGYSVLFKLQWPQLRKITGGIVQPRLSEEVGPRETEMVLEGAELEAAPEFLAGRIRAALANPMHLETGKGCRWCDAALRCPAMEGEDKYWTDLAPIITKIKNEDKTMTYTLTPEILEALKAEDPTQALARICIAAKLLTPRFEDAKDAIKQVLAANPEILTPDGTRLFLKQRGGIRELTNPQEAWHRIAGKLEQASDGTLDFVPGLLDEGEAIEAVTISIAELERIVAKKFIIPVSSTKKECGESKVAGLLDGLIEQPTQKVLTIVSA